MTFPGLYDIYGVRGDQLIQSEKPHKGSPTEAWMIEWGKRRGCQAVIRLFPTRKGYRLLDITEVRSFQPQNQKYPIYHGQVRGRRFWPSVDAAIMAWLHEKAG